MAKSDFEPLRRSQVEKVKQQIRALKPTTTNVFHQFPLYHSTSWGAEMDITGKKMGDTYVYELTVDLPKASTIGNNHFLIKTVKIGGSYGTKNSQERGLEDIKNAAIKWLDAAPKN